MVPFLCTAVKGSGWCGVGSLFTLGALSKTRSHTITVGYTAFRVESACCFIYNLAVVSLTRNLSNLYWTGNEVESSGTFV